MDVQTSCPECDYLNNIDSLFCEHCGWRLNPAKNYTNPFLVHHESQTTQIKDKQPKSVTPASSKNPFEPSHEFESIKPFELSKNPFETSRTHEPFHEARVFNPFNESQSSIDQNMTIVQESTRLIHPVEISVKSPFEYELGSLGSSPVGQVQDMVYSAPSQPDCSPQISPVQAMKEDSAIDTVCATAQEISTQTVAYQVNH